MGEFANDVCVVGLGYVGRPVVTASLAVGLSVVGLDVDPVKLADLRRHAQNKPLVLTQDASILSSCRVVVICVPTPLTDDRSPDLSAVLNAVEALGRHLRPGHVVILESTVAPGTTEGIVREVLERESGLTVGSDFSLAFSPERIDPGNPAFDLVNTPKIVGGITSRCTEAASTFYEQFVTTIHPASRAREAESAKILENLYRNVNIALVNEFAIACHALGIDVHEAIDLAATKPFGFTAFRPGAGVGGHCIPIDPQYFDFLVRERTGLPMRFIEVANQVNEGMSNYVGRLAQDALNELGRPLRGSTVLLLGVAYKPDIDDTRETPAAPISRWLADHGARVVFHDPHVAFWDNSALAERTSQPDLESSMSDADLNVALQAHRHYRSTTLSADVAGKTLAIAYPVFPEARFRL